MNLVELIHDQMGEQKESKEYLHLRDISINKSKELEATLSDEQKKLFLAYEWAEDEVNSQFYFDTIKNVLKIIEDLKKTVKKF